MFKIFLFLAVIALFQWKEVISFLSTTNVCSVSPTQHNWNLYSRPGRRKYERTVWQVQSSLSPTNYNEEGQSSLGDSGQLQQTEEEEEEEDEEPVLSFYSSKARAEINGNLYVDEKCIDCDVCRWMCPSVYNKRGVFAAVYQQPRTNQEKIDAYGALIACPVGAIRMKEGDSLMKDAIKSFPKPIDLYSLPGVMHAGFHAAKSFGATPYFLQRKAGNVMIDCPRFSSHLAKRLDELGGIHTMIFTHRDDIADHRKWKERFPQLQRVIHSFDVTPASNDCEIKLQGRQKWYPDNDIEIIHTPGHTSGSICILYDTPHDGDSVLFTGDHLANDESDTEAHRLTGFKQFNCGNLEAQAESIAMLATNEYDFTWILPGHGRRRRFQSLTEKNEAILLAAKEFREESMYAQLFHQGYHPRR